MVKVSKAGSFGLLLASVVDVTVPEVMRMRFPTSAPLR